MRKSHQGIGITVNINKGASTKSIQPGLEYRLRQINGIEANPVAEPVLQAFGYTAAPAQGKTEKSGLQIVKAHTGRPVAIFQQTPGKGVTEVVQCVSKRFAGRPAGRPMIILWVGILVGHPCNPMFPNQVLIKYGQLLPRSRPIPYKMTVTGIGLVVVLQSRPFLTFQVGRIMRLPLIFLKQTSRFIYRKPRPFQQSEKIHHQVHL